MATQGGQGGEALQRRGAGGMPAGPFSLIDWMLDRLQRDFFGGAWPAPAMPGLGQGGSAMRAPRLNINETDSEIVIAAEVPGVDPNDVQVDVEDDVLTLRAEARETREEDGGQVVSYARYFTQLPLPEGVDPESIKATSRNGIVTLRFPKQRQTRNARRIPISAEGGASGEQQRGSEGGSGAGKSRAA
jgi:HSP20 family protein